jgi:hypothetical protein
LCHSVLDGLDFDVDVNLSFKQAYHTTNKATIYTVYENNWRVFISKENQLYFILAAEYINRKCTYIKH